MNRIRTAAIQMCAGGSKHDNLETALSQIDLTVERFGPLDLIVLPEYCYGEPTPSTVGEVAESLPGPFSEAMQGKAQQHKVNLVTGSFAEAAPDGRAYNTTLVFNREGSLLGSYRKVHLMEGLAFHESEFVAPGDSLCLIDTDVGKLGIMVCFDLRFPEVARSLVLGGAEIIAIPSAFPSGRLLPPRTDHWDTLTTSTALYNLCYVVAANQFGQLNDEYPFGRSMIVDPWGIPVAKAQGRDDIIFGELDLEYLRQLREDLPTLKLRRPELYEWQ
jgi:predicted amidohydrolase